MIDGLMCGFCGYDDARYQLRSDAVSSLVIPVTVLAAAIEALPDTTLNQRPDESTWSIAEYIGHVAEVYAVHRDALERAQQSTSDAIEWPDVEPFTEERRTIDCTASLDAAGEHAVAIQTLAKAASDTAWGAGFARHVRNVVHEGFHHLVDVGDISARLGYGPSAATGRVTRLSASDGGVPKQSIDQAAITSAGVEGDSQNDRTHHGRPCQALCLYSADVIAALQAEGHPIEAGNAGENITVEGIEWASLRPGSRITIGSVPMVISAYAIPCAKNKPWFNDGYFNRMLHDKHPGWSRLYAVPFAAGTIRTNDPVTVGS